MNKDLEIIIFISCTIIYCIYYKIVSILFPTLENILKRKKFRTILSLHKPYIIATKDSTNYLFIKHNKYDVFNRSLLKKIKETAEKFESKKIIIYFYAKEIPIEVSK